MRYKLPRSRQRRFILEHDFDDLVIWSLADAAAMKQTQSWILFFVKLNHGAESRVAELGILELSAVEVCASEVQPLRRL